MNRAGAEASSYVVIIDVELRRKRVRPRLGRYARWIRDQRFGGDEKPRSVERVLSTAGAALLLQQGYAGEKGHSSRRGSSSAMPTCAGRERHPRAIRGAGYPPPPGRCRPLAGDTDR